MVWRVFSRNFLVFLKTWKANIMFNFVEPVMYLWAMGFGLGVYVEMVQGIPYVQYLAPGLIASSAMFATSFEMTYGSFTRMTHHKTFQAMVATPVSMEDVVAGEIVYGSFKSLLYGLVFLLVIWLFGLVKSPWVLLLPGVLVLCGLVFSILAMIWSSLAPDYDAFNYYFTLIITPMFLFSGIFFPLTGLPPIAQKIAWLTPLYHVVELSRALVLGRVGDTELVHLAWLLVLVLLTFRLPLVMVKNRLIQ
jgi:lipooligosaccharide transport system permease protein